MKYVFINNKKIIPIVIVIILVLVVGVSYAFFSYSRVGDENSQLVAGDVYMHFKENGNEIILNNAFPETKEEAKLRNDNYMTFTISGKNTTKNKDIYYELKLDEGSEIEGKTRFNSKDLKFELIETIDGVKETVIDGLSYEDFNDHRFYVNTIPNQTNNEIEISYQLRMWISDEVIISDTEVNANYTTDVYKNSYASIKVNVYGDFVEKKVMTLADKTMEKLDLDVNNENDGCPVEGEQITSIAGAGVDLICEYSDDDGTSYYFRGASTHNYVKWAGFYWRIIRVNGDGNIRMIYAGDADTIDALPNKQEVLSNGYDDSSTDYTQIGTSKFNSSYTGNQYVGLMYGDNLPDVYDTVGVVSADSVTTTALSTTSAYYYGTGYTIDAKSGKMKIIITTSITITADNISNLVGKYMFADAKQASSYNIPLILVESVDSSALTVTGKQITRKLIDGLDIEEAYDKTHENKKYSTIMGTGDSTNTNDLNGWYNNNIKGTEYESQVADSIICNDRSLYKEEYGTKYSSSTTYLGIKGYSGTSENSGLGIGIEITGFGPYYRNYRLYKPSLKCENRNDRFTVSNSKGNQALANSIGLISADEVALAGGRASKTNNGYYLYSGNDYWTSSPSSVYGNGSALAWLVLSTGYLHYGYAVNCTYGVRPVLSLDPLRLNIEGSGTWDDPFVFTGK